MFISINKLANELLKDGPYNLTTNALQEGHILQMPEAPEVYSQGFGKNLKQKAMVTLKKK